MSVIRAAIEKIDEMISKLPNTESLLETELKEIKDLLTDDTVLFLEWGEEDIQNVARQRIAYTEDVEECKIKENPLTREQVADVIGLLEKQYDCNYGITWDNIYSVMDYIDLPVLIEVWREE